MGIWAKLDEFNTVSMGLGAGGALCQKVLPALLEFQDA